MTKPFTPEQFIHDLIKDYTESKTAEEIKVVIKSYAATLRLWKESI